MTPHYLNGKLSLDENDIDRMNYIVTDLSTGEQQSITDILDTIYNGTNTINKLVRVAGRIYNSSHTFNGFETLHISKDKSGTYSYFVGNFPIENQLYELAENNSNVEIVIEDYTDATKFMITTGTTEDTNDNTSIAS